MTTSTIPRGRVSRAELAAAGQRRGAALANQHAASRDGVGLGQVPVSAARKGLSFPAHMLADTIRYNGQDMVRLRGVASVVGVSYEMWDMFGPYTETIRPDAFDTTLAANPDVAFLLNHEGITMARTIAMVAGKKPTLMLAMVAGPEPTDNGLGVEAYVNPKRDDIAIMLSAIDDGLITEMSFAFMIVRGYWSDDYMSFEIAEVDIHRGDVSAVNYGANPYTSIGARQRLLLDQVRAASLPTATGILHELERRGDLDITAELAGARRPAPPAPASRVAIAVAVDTDADEDDDEALICPSCGTANEADALYCDQCGTSLEGVAPVSGAPVSGAGAMAAASSAPSQQRLSGLTLTSVRAMFPDDLLM